MAMNDYEMIREKVEFYMDNEVKVHVDLTDGTFLNGLIIKKLKDNVYWLEERKLGQVFLFLKDIDKINEFREVRE